MTGIGGAIRAARQAKGMSLRQLGEALGVSVPFLSDVELNRRGVDRHVGNICRVLGVPREAIAASKLLRDEIDWIEAHPDVLAGLRRKMAAQPSPTHGGGRR